MPLPASRRSLQPPASQSGRSSARFDSKSAVFLAVLRDLIRTWLSGFDESLENAATLEDALLAAARKMLDVALTPAALALHALVTAEAMRFPEMGGALRQSGADIGIRKVSALLLSHAPHLTPEYAQFVAEQFQSLVVLAPQRRAMGLGPALDPAARDRWCRATVALVLHGISAPPAPSVKPRVRSRSASNSDA